MKRLEKASFVIGLLMLGWLIVRIGPESVGRDLADLGWRFALLFVLQAIPYLLLTIAWRLMLPPGHGVSLTALWRMLVSCEAINAVSPVAVVGGELMRVSLLSRRIPVEEAVPSVALAAMTQFCAQILFVLSGIPIALWLVRGPALHQGLVVLAGILAVLLGVLLFGGFSAVAHRWLARAADRSTVVRAIARRIPAAWSDAIPRMLRAMRERPGRFAMSVCASLLYWQMGALETYLILRFLHAPVAAALAYGIEALAVVIEGLLFFVPAKMGTQEGGKTLIFLLAGLDPAKGLALGLIRRIRELAWAAVGFGLLGATPSREALRSPDDARAAQAARLT
jgi:uncharacterized protein (TIRG00374 family)